MTVLVEKARTAFDANNEMLIAMGLPSREHHNTPDPVPTEKGNVKHSVRGDMHKFSLNRQMDNQPVKSSISKVAHGQIGFQLLSVN